MHSFSCTLMFSDGNQLPHGEAYKARNLGNPLTNNQQGTESLCPIAHEEPNPTNNHVNENGSRVCFSHAFI